MLSIQRVSLPLLLCMTVLVHLSTYVAAEQVSLQLRWLHQFQFAGYYMALEKGFYKEVGLEVSLLEGGPHALAPVERVLAGEVDFAVSSSGAVIHRLEGRPVVALAAIMQTSPIVWITLSESNIRTPHELIGKNALIMSAPESAELLTMLLREGLQKDKVHLIPSTYRIDDLIEGKVDAFDAYVSNEPFYLKQHGIDYHLINPRDYGINFYGDVLMTSEKLAKGNPTLVSQFTEASLKGWQYAFDHTVETIHLIHEKYAPNKSLAHLRFEAEKIRELVMPELVAVGHMNPGRWEFIAESYKSLNMTEGRENLDGFIFEKNGERDIRLALKVAISALCLLVVLGCIIWRFSRLSRKLRREISSREKVEQELLHSNKELANLAVTDPLTGVKNRRGFFDQAYFALSQAWREETAVSLLMLDLDNFKQVNDQYGHPAGDETLRQFAAILDEQRRVHDVVGRVGGEEFAVLLVGSDREHANNFSKRIMQRVRQLRIQVPDTQNQFGFTVSIGVAAVSESLDDSWRLADAALYEAKDMGRDTIKVAD